MALYTLKRGDRQPPLRALLLDALSRPIDLSGATVTFNMKPKPGCTGDQIEGGTVAVNDIAKADVQYEWMPGDTDVAGGYSGEFRITFSDASFESVPNDGMIDIQIIENAAST